MPIGQVEVDSRELEAAIQNLLRTSEKRLFESLARACRTIMVREMKDLAPKDSNALSKSITAKTGQDDEGFFVDVGSFGIVYAAMQEFGGVFRRVNGQATDERTGSAFETGVINSEFNKTKRMESFFWAMYAETGDDMWKAMALADKITIPAHPYIRPAFETTWRRVAERTGEILARRITQ